MTVIASCGHKLKDDEDEIKIVMKEVTRENTLATSYRTVCKECFTKYSKFENYLGTWE